MMLKEIMQKKLVTIAPDSTIREAARKMKSKGVGSVLIVNGMKLKGFLTDRDIACWLAEGKDPDKQKVKDIMRTKIVTAKPNTDLHDASKLMGKKNVRRLPIIEGKSLVGIVTTSDIAPFVEEEVDSFFHLEKAYHH